MVNRSALGNLGGNKKVCNIDRDTAFGKHKLLVNSFIAGFLVLFALLPFVQENAHAAQITLAWDAEDGAAGYKIYYGTASDAYTTSVDVGNVTTHPLTLDDGHTYYLAVTAYDSAKLESDFSAEITYKTEQTYYLSVQKGGSGSGRVTSSPLGMDCGSTCGVPYKKGTRVTLIPTPESGSVFTGWTGDCAGSRTCSVIITSDKTVGAVFEMGSCTYTISSGSKTLTHRGGSVTLGVTAKDHTNCVAPDIINNTDWITYTASAFSKNKGSIKFFVSEYDNSVGRSGTFTIGEKTFSLTQKGKPCTLTLSSPSSPLFPQNGGTGSFNVTVTPADCEWTPASETSSTWLHPTAGSGRIDYRVDENTGTSTRNGKITVILSLSNKSKSYSVKQVGK